MPHEWSFRHEFLLIARRWPLLIAVCLIGALSGWLVSLVWPTPHRATRELYVGLNAYRAINDTNAAEYAGLTLINANDYKNWQMSSLNNLIFMDRVIDSTLFRLREQDPYWENIDRDDFAGSLHVYWRNAGKWRLVAEHRDPSRAAEAVSAWQEIVVDTVHKAVTLSQEALLYEIQLQSLADQKAEISKILSEITSAKSNLTYWQTDLGTYREESIIDADEHWQIWMQLVDMRTLVSWDDFLDTFPPEGSSRKYYIEWLDQAIFLTNKDIENLDRQLNELRFSELSAADRLSEASKGSLGLSASLDVDKISETRTLHTTTRPAGILMLSGSLLGLFASLGYWICQIGLRGKA